MRKKGWKGKRGKKEHHFLPSLQCVVRGEERNGGRDGEMEELTRGAFYFMT